MDTFSINNVKSATDNVDSFDGIWLDDHFDGGVFQDGEWIDLPDRVGGNTLRVSLTMGVYYPKAPIYRMDVYDETLAKQKLAEGYFVIPEGEGYLELDPVEGLSWVVQGGWNRRENMFTYQALTVSFNVDATPGKAAKEPLTTEPSYAVGAYTAKFRKAVLTPVALYTNFLVSATAKDGILPEGNFVLADAQGKKLGDYVPDGCSYGEEQQDGTVAMMAEYAWRGLPDGLPPEQFAIVFVPSDGSENFSLPMSR